MRLALLTAGSLLAVTAPPSEAAVKRCGPGLRAGANTSCPLARALLRKIGRESENIGDGRRVAVRSPITGRTYRFYLYRGDSRSFTCKARGDRGSTLSVIIDT
jgi:hypothetical protein